MNESSKEFKILSSKGRVHNLKVLKGQVITLEFQQVDQNDTDLVYLTRRAPSNVSHQNSRCYPGAIERKNSIFVVSNFPLQLRRTKIVFDSPKFANDWRLETIYSSVLNVSSQMFQKTAKDFIFFAKFCKVFVSL